MTSRRNFIVYSLSAIPAIAFRNIGYQDRSAPLQIVCRDEPGQPIQVSGHVYEADGQTPMRGAALYIYQTDDSGFYSKPKNDPRTARINNWIPVGNDGAYAFRTILPGHYVVENPPPRHIHVHLSAPGAFDHWIDSFLFAGDPFLTRDQISKNKGMERRSAIMQPVRRTAGMVYYVRDILFDRALAERNQLVNGWYRNP